MVKVNIQKYTLDECSKALEIIKSEVVPFKLLDVKWFYVNKQRIEGTQRVYYLLVKIECEESDVDLLETFDRFVKEIVRHDTIRRTKRETL